MSGLQDFLLSICFCDHCKARAARRMGVEDFRFYNYGLIPQSHLDWIREALQ